MGAGFPEDEAWRAAARASWLETQRGRPNDVNSTGNDALDPNDPRFVRCWRRQDCKSCLGIAACSWCPFVRDVGRIAHYSHATVYPLTSQSAACVPNEHLIPALAPAWAGDLVCPYWAERWELRTRPLGCQVSTITSLTALVAGSGTLLVALLLWLLVVGVRRARRRQWQWPVTAVCSRWATAPLVWLPKRRRPGGEPAPAPTPTPTAPATETTPLLSDG